ncbi:MAG TPA: hypothetical protein VJV77_11420 [Casimicrobiaceae bacterium]|nr:hypothetical protein [Casimicrobiaceae bacterium]
MNKHTKQALAAVTFALAFGVAHADNDHGRACSDATLRGLYVFSTTGFNIVGGIAQPKAINEQIRFNGDGTLTAPVATSSVNGNVNRSTDVPGTYVLASNCAGSLSFIPGPSFDVIADPRGTAVYMIQTAPGTPVMQGVAERVSR